MYVKFSYVIVSLLLILSFNSNAQNLIINEILSSNTKGILDQYGDHSDWIEIYKPSSENILLEGYYLSDDTQEPLKWIFPNCSIGPNDYLLIFASGKDSNDHEIHCNFKLSQEGEHILLSNANGDLIDQLDSVPQQKDISYGHQLSGSGILKYFDLPTPLEANNSTAYQGVLNPPFLSHESGFYAQNIVVSASHEDADVQFRYTTDGSDPTEESLPYTEALLFEDAANNPNVYSEIPTNPSFDYPQPGFTESRANNRGWLRPYNLVNKVNVLKIKAFKDHYIASEAYVATYIIHPDTTDRYQFPLLSITTDDENLFDDEMGIYVYGSVGEEGNYAEHGKDWERPVHLTFFENDGSLAFEQNFGARIHGGGGRHSTLKNLRLYAREEYGKSTLEYKWFPNDNTNEYKRFLVRGAGHRPDCIPRDDFAGLLIENQNMDIQHIRHVILFINGEYWGIHSVKERFDQEYLSQKYGKKADDYVIMRNRGDLDSGEPGDDEPYFQLLDFVKSNDMGLESSYDFVKTQLDIDNYLNYFSSEVYMGNVDWIVTNIKFWRYKGLDQNSRFFNGLDGKWRWFMFDFDLVFGGSCADVTPNVNVLSLAFDTIYGRATTLAIGLKENHQFVYDLVNRMCDHMNSNFSKKNFREKLAQIDSEMTPEMPEHIERWRYPSVAATLEDRQYETPSLIQWDTILASLYLYPDERKRKMIDHMTEEFALQDTLQLVLDVNDQMMGNIQVNSLFISEALDGVSEEVYPWGGTYFKNVPIPIIAKPKLGYRFVEWVELSETNDTLVLSFNGGDTLTALFEEDPHFVFDHALYINEFMAVNRETVKDEYQAYSDWIELYNPNDQPVDLADYYISDDIEEVFKYQFPRGSQQTVIQAKSFMLVWCDGRSERGPLHTNFRLNGDGESIILSAPDSSVIDYLSFGAQQEDVSYGRQEDGDEMWKYFQIPDDPTPGATNNKSGIEELAPLEVMMYPNPVSKGQKLYFTSKVSIEIYNYLGQLINTKEDVYHLETHRFSKGVYIVRFEDTMCQKLIIK